MKRHFKIRAGLAAVSLLTAGCSMGASKLAPDTPQQAPSGASSSPETLSSSGQAQLRAAIDKGRLENLQWPNFSDVSMNVKEFYEKDGYALVWTRGGRPTEQAVQLIGVLEEAPKKGLDSTDYDGERWLARLKDLAAGAKPDESALVNFDLALTVSGLRYASDLHLGKLDPRTLHTDFEPERNEYDLCDFLLKRVAVAASVND